MKKQAFTLIELVISIAIIALSFYTLINVLSHSLFKNTNNQQTITATFLAEKAMEEFIAEDKSWSNLTTVETTSFTGDFSKYSYRIDVEEVDPSDLNQEASSPPTDYKRIEVLVTGEGVGVPVKLITLKTNY